MSQAHGFFLLRAEYTDTKGFEEVFPMKKRYAELWMACLLLVCFYALSRKAAFASKPSDADTNTRGVIVIDAGHGGSDPGMIGVNQIEEKGINLAISLKLRDCLEKLGYEVYLTRESDRDLSNGISGNKKSQDMLRRIELIREKKPILAVSIHQNSFQDPQVCGPQVFYYETSEEGKRLARYIQTSLNEELKAARPRVEKGNQSYYLLKHSPAVLTIVECGFLTNPAEAQWLQTEEYQEKVADAIAHGIQNYLESVQN